MKVSELTGKDLDEWVAKAQGWEKVVMPNKYESYWEGGINPRVWYYTPSTNGGQCFELLTSNDFETESYHIEDDEQSHYANIVGSNYGCHGSTLNIAICRAFVASVYGAEVSDEHSI